MPAAVTRRRLAVDLGLSLGLAVAYFLLARIGMLFSVHSMQVSFLWLSAGLVLAAVLLLGPRLAIGWTMGTLVSAVGVYLSLKIDLPTGATIVCTFALVLIAMAALRGIVRRRVA